MRDLKEYRRNELKWFLLANIILMILGDRIFAIDLNELCNQLKSGTSEDMLRRGIKAVISGVGVSAFVYLFVFVVDAIIPSTFKRKMLHVWRKPQSQSIFTDIRDEKITDYRFYTDQFVKKYADIYQMIDSSDKYKKKQEPLFYQIYSKHRDTGIVFGCKRDCLILRDLNSSAMVLGGAYLAVCALTKISLSKFYLLILLVQIFILNIAGNIREKSFVLNVLAFDVHS